MLMQAWTISLQRAQPEEKGHYEDGSGLPHYCFVYNSPAGTCH